MKTTIHPALLLSLALMFPPLSSSAHSAAAKTPVASASSAQTALVKQNHDKLEKVKLMESYYLKRGRTPEEARKEAWEAVSAQEARDKLRAEGKLKTRPAGAAEAKADATAGTKPAARLKDSPADSIYQTAQASSRPVDMVLVRKSVHQMELIKDHKILKKYFVALGKSPKGHKQHRGDRRTPEGVYVLDYKKPSAEYTLSIHISYPNADDLKSARERGVDPGGMIMIHGQPSRIGHSEDETRDGEFNVDKFLQPSNWTNGCIALLDNDMAEVYRMIEPGTPITILP